MDGILPDRVTDQQNRLVLIRQSQRDSTDEGGFADTALAGSQFFSMFLSRQMKQNPPRHRMAYDRVVWGRYVDNQRQAGFGTSRKLIVLALAAALAFWLFRAGHIDVVGLAKALQSWVPEHPVLGATVFFALYTAAASFAVPGVFVLTLLGGSLFGLVEGTVLVSFASTIGASFAMLAARYLVRDVVQSRFQQRLEPINTGVAKDGALYLLSLRLIPAVPFFLINIAVGLTKMPLHTFIWVSQLGMLPATVLYVFAGSRLAEVSAPSDILTAPIILAFIGMAALPFVMKAIVARVKANSALNKWPKPKQFDYNLVVIGGGSAGLVTSYIAAAANAKVALIEQDQMGGDCLNTGCVPSKALIRSAKLLKESQKAAEYGFSGELQADFAAIMAQVHRVIGEVAPHDSVERYSGLGVEVITGHARILDPWTVEVDGRKLVSRRIVLASGAEPAMPPIAGLAEIGALTSQNLWNLKQLPKRLLVVGGGAIGCELAQSFARLGSTVTLVEGAPRLMIREDEEVSAAAKATLESDHVRVMTGAAVQHFKEVTGQKQGFIGAKAIAFDEVIIAVGRKPRVSGFGLEELGLLENGRLVLDASFRTRIPTIFAAGDVAGQLQFTHAASHYAWYAAMNSLFGGLKTWNVQAKAFPMVTFTDPEIARVGLNETEAKAKNIAFDVTRYDLAELDRAIADGSTTGFIKVLTAPGKDRILGVTIVGARAGDILSEFTLAMTHGLGLNAILKTIHPYPGWSDAAKAVAGAWRKSHLSPRLLDLSRRYHRWMRG